MEAIRELMAAHHRKISAEVATIREDLKVLSARLGTVECTSSGHTSQIEELKATVHDLKQLAALHDQQLATQKDKRRQNNLKLQGVADSVPEAELPHYARRLLTALLTPKVAKSIILDNIFRIPWPTTAPPAATGDIILRFQSARDKRAVLEATKGLTIYTFEDMTL
ncbi:Hypothetical predicted protein [Pelobates cultripes]|uniref:Uncharacterized protein n=1 Tax=Pelobates cultripes TaxID=61616 RepID=A0AAD1TCM0_PELCU|nr:Hypothetical predicted protein [Pelobates cultripes]